MAVMELNALSVCLSGSFSATVFLPERSGLQSNKRYPALYLIHDIGGNDTDWRNVKNLEALAEKYGVFIIAPSLMHSFAQDLPWGGKYGDFVARELPGICGHMLPLDKTRTYIGGTGWGAWAAVKQAMDHPEVFKKCIAVDGCFDVVGLCADALAGHTLPHLSLPMVEAVFAPLDKVAGSRFDLFAGSALPEELFLGCVEQGGRMTQTEEFANRTGRIIHTAAAEEALWDTAIGLL